MRLILICLLATSLVGCDDLSKVQTKSIAGSSLSAPVGSPFVAELIEPTVASEDITLHLRQIGGYTVNDCKLSGVSVIREDQRVYIFTKDAACIADNILSTFRIQAYAIDDNGLPGVRMNCEGKERCEPIKDASIRFNIMKEVQFGDAMISVKNL